jgi:hypothetical protein
MRILVTTVFLSSVSAVSAEVSSRWPFRDCIAAFCLVSSFLILCSISQHSSVHAQHSSCFCTYVHVWSMHSLSLVYWSVSRQLRGNVGNPECYGSSGTFLCVSCLLAKPVQFVHIVLELLDTWTTFSFQLCKVSRSLSAHIAPSTNPIWELDSTSTL